jgi:hypothetical protein
VKRQPKDWEKIFTNHTYNKGLILKYVRNSDFNSKKINTLVKNRQRTHFFFFSEKKTYKWPAHIPKKNKKKEMLTGLDGGSIFSF